MIHDTEALVCVDIRYRQQLGIKKYGTTLAENPLSLREWLEHAYQETLDKALYLKRAIQEIDEQEAIANGRDDPPKTAAYWAKRNAMMQEVAVELGKLFGTEYAKYTGEADGNNS